MKALSKTQRAQAWRIALRYLGFSLNGNDPYRGTDGMTTKLATLTVGRRLGRRIRSRCVKQGYTWVDRGICIIGTERHAGKIGSSATGRSGWHVNSQGAIPGSPSTATPTAHAVTVSSDGTRSILRIRYGFPSERQARTWLLTPEGQGELRKVFLKIKPDLCTTSSNSGNANGSPSASSSAASSDLSQEADRSHRPSGSPEIAGPNEADMAAVLQRKSIADASVTAAPPHIIDGAKTTAAKEQITIALFFDSGADEKYADDLGYGYGPVAGVQFLFHPLLGRVVAFVHPDGTIEPS